MAGAWWSLAGNDQGLRTDNAAVGAPYGVLVRPPSVLTFVVPRQVEVLRLASGLGVVSDEDPEHLERTEYRATGPRRR